MSRLVRLTNKSSDNFFAEQLLKALAALESGIGTTAGGARVAMAAGRGFGAPSNLVDGSGLARGNRASPKSIVRLLTAARASEWFAAFYDSLPIAGRDGTLHDRMETRAGAAPMPGQDRHHRRRERPLGLLHGRSRAT